MDDLTDISVTSHEFDEVVKDENKINKEMEAQPDKLVVDETKILQRKGLYDDIFQDYPSNIGKALSRKEREATGQIQSSLVYGEIKFESFAICIEKIRQKYGVKYGILQQDGGVFCDIGSGTGKPVFGAVLMHPFKRAYGIEILEGLHVASSQILKQWNDKLISRLDERMQHTDIQFIHGDATDLSTHDWTDADVLFINSTCFSDKLMDRLAFHAAKMKNGAIAITLTKSFNHKSFVTLEEELMPMSWGKASVFIQQRTSDPFSSPSPMDQPIESESD